MLEYFGLNPHPLPPVINPGRIGNIIRYSNETKVVKPEKNAPVPVTIEMVNKERQRKNRAEIMLLLRAGIQHANEIAEIAKLNNGTIWNHLKPMEKEGLITIDRTLKPWPIKLTDKGRQ